MVKKEEVMLTNVDALLHLIEKRKKISMSQAAEELKTDEATIENWTNVLEEEGLVGVKYSLTTPYIEIKTQKKAGHDGMFANKDKAYDYSKETKELSKGERIREEVKHEATFQNKEHVEVSHTSLTSLGEDDIKSMISLTKSLVKQRNFEQAEETYATLKKAYDSLPAVFLERKNKIENELIKINNELSVEFQKQEFERIKNGIKSVNDLLKQGNQFIKKKQIDQAVELYNQIKSIYNLLPEGFYGEKTKLAEDILDFFQKLSLITNALNKQNMQIKANQILALVNQIEALIAMKNVEKAIQTYSELKQVYSTLPPGFLDKKLDIQEKMINIYRQLMVDKKSILKQDIDEKIRTIKTLLQYAYNYMKNHDINNATKSFNDAKAIFEKMPKAFSDEYDYTQKLLLKYYKQLIELKKYVSLQSIKQGSSKIHKMMEKIKKAYKNKDFDISYDLYRAIVAEYNLFPIGFDPGKLEIRKQIYKLYYDIVSGKDLLELGELNPYVKVRYFKLLDLLVNTHEIVDSNQFSLIDKLYSQIYSIYNELPVYMINKNFLLKREVGRIFEMQRMYQAALNLERYSSAKDMRGLRFTLSFINKNFMSAEKNCYGFVKLLKFVKQEYEKYVVKSYPVQQVILPETRGPVKIRKPRKPLTSVLRLRKPTKEQLLAKQDEEEERKGIEQLFKLKKSKYLYRAALKNIREGDYVTATKALERLLRLDPENKLIDEKLIEVAKLRRDKFKNSMVDRLIIAKKNRLKKYIENNNYDNAVEEVYTILELNPDDKEAKLLLDKINFEKSKART